MVIQEQLKQIKKGKNKMTDKIFELIEKENETM